MPAMYSVVAQSSSVICMAVMPSLVIACASAPFSKSSRATSALPKNAAACNAVAPLLWLGASTSAPPSRSATVNSGLALTAANTSGGLPSAPKALTSAPACIAARTAVASPANSADQMSPPPSPPLSMAAISARPASTSACSRPSSNMLEMYSVVAQSSSRMSHAEAPSLFKAPVSTPRSKSSAAAGELPTKAAPCRAVPPSRIDAFASAPLATSHSTASCSPAMTAIKSGVIPTSICRLSKSVPAALCASSSAKSPSPAAVQMSLAGGAGGSAGTIGAAGVVSCCGETQAASAATSTRPPSEASRREMVFMRCASFFSSRGHDAPRDNELEPVVVARVYDIFVRG